jgi:hypothetical protein
MNRKILLFVFAVLIFGAGSGFADTLKGMSLNGSTGLIGIPSGRIGWERTSDFGFDLGYHAIFDDDVTTHIPKASVSLFKMLEAGFAYDTQGEENDDDDQIIHGKIQLPIQRATAIAIGGNAQMISDAAGNEENYQQIYLAATYPGDFFNMPAETTVVVGKTFGENTVDENIDFGMGFDLLLFPDVFQGYIHWINDFSNFSYSVTPRGANAGIRGAFNTGIRIDLASIPEFSEFKFAVDAIMTDALDENRAFALGVAFGAALK